MSIFTKLTLCIAILLCINATGTAQFYFYNDKYYEDDVTFEIGGSAGIMNCLTDIGGKKGIGKGFIKDLNGKNTQMAYGGYMEALYKHTIGLRLEGTFGKLKAYDSILSGDNSDAKNRYYRNLNFKTNISEFSAMLELHPLFLKTFDITDDVVPRFSPYLLAGIGFFRYKPQGYLNGAWIDLQPLRTEGQGFTEYPDKKQYSLSQMNVPLGIGLKYELGSLLSARFEILHRVLFTDYLDDVSGKYIDPTTYNNNLTPANATKAMAWYNQTIGPTPANYTADNIRGNTKRNDSYFTVNLKLGIVLNRTRIR